MSQHDDQGGFDTQDLELEEFDDAPTQRFEDLPPNTDPAHAGVLEADVAQEIRREHEVTVHEDEKLTFVGRVDEQGRIVVGEELRGALKPGDELIIRAEKIS